MHFFLPLPVITIYLPCAPGNMAVLLSIPPQSAYLDRFLCTCIPAASYVAHLSELILQSDGRISSSTVGDRDSKLVSTQVLSAVWNTTHCVHSINVSEKIISEITVLLSDTIEEVKEKIKEVQKTTYPRLARDDDQPSEDHELMSDYGVKNGDHLTELENIRAKL